MNKLFETTQIGNLTLRNRMVRSATWEGMCQDDGRPTTKLIEFYRQLAKGGVGLIITGYTFVRPDGKQLMGKMGITADFASEMKAMTQAVHDEGSAICMQLVHAGGQTSDKMIGRTPLAPSAIAAQQYQGVTPEAMSTEDIDEISDAFAESARLAQEFGFDAIQLHGAHGYLINQFLSPVTNQRTDDYGGSIENRSRFMMTTYDKIRAAVGDNFPVTIKLTGADNLEGGFTNDDAITAAKLLSDAGIDAIEVSGGTAASGDEGPLRTKINKPEKEAYNLTNSLNIKKAVSCPVMTIGGMRSMELAEKAIADGMDFIAMSRPLIREPNLPERWRSGDTAKATCISCNKCFMGGLKEGGIYCAVEKKLQEKKQG
jgi:2,4-dienoyl-CoA reductase-like NADH-dependent reductase (Old Yellow Enzyme family)